MVFQDRAVRTAVATRARPRRCTAFPARVAAAVAAAALVTLAGGCSLSPLGALDAVVPESGYTRRADIAYGEDPRQRVDVYFPDEPAARSKRVLFVYGGAWRSGDRERYRFVAQALAAAGHVVILPDYRLYPAVRYPAFVDDVVAAVVHLAGRDDLWGEEPLDEIVVMGHSSGAHTAALLAADPRWLAASGVDASALIGLSGPYRLPLDNPEVGAVFASVTDAGSVRPPALATPAHPPTLLVHGKEDERVVPRHTAVYAAALTALDVPHTVRWLDGTGHAGTVAGLAAPLQAINGSREAVTRFLDAL